MFLIPHDDPHVQKFGKEMKTYPLQAKSPNEADSIIIPMKFEIAVSRFLHYKIEAGKLYKKEQHKWVLHEI